MTRLKIVTLFISLFLLQACSSNSGLLFRGAYNNLDVILSSKFNSYADFSAEQKQWITLSVQDFHQWHRDNQLPEIETLLSSAIFLANENKGFPKEVIEQYVTQTRSLYEQAYLASPLFDAAPLLATVSQGQVNQIKTKMAQNTQEYKEETQEAHSSTSRIERVDRFLDFFDVTLSKTQRQYVIAQLEKYQDTRVENEQILENWQDEFIALLDKREQADFEIALENHFKQFLLIFDREDLKASRQHNRTLLIETAHEVLNTFSDNQRSDLTQRLQSLQSDINQLMTK